MIVICNFALLLLINTVWILIDAFFWTENSYRCFGGEVLEGYGMTETSCVISTMDIGDKLIGHVGSPNPSCGKALCLDFQGYNIFFCV
jgi:acyl-CoA synthetase (AMP-forming)/AMP-acid ligase II